MSKLKNRIGEIGINNQGCKMKIIEYNTCKNIVVVFLDEQEYKTRCTYRKFKNGEIKNHRYKSYFGVGFCGDGEYKMYDNNGKSFRVTQCWVDMLDRCYGVKHKEKYKAYKDCIVSNEWHNFQNFAKWYFNEIYNCKENLNLDKDIMYCNNKIYSPETCMLIPQSINKAAISGNGTTYHKRDLCWEANISENGKQIYLGRFVTQKEGREAYLKYKNKIWQNKIESWKEYLPEKVYNACKKKVFI